MDNIDSIIQYVKIISIVLQVVKNMVKIVRGVGGKRIYGYFGFSAIFSIS